MSKNKKELLAVITGGAKGIGAAMANAFSERGVKVIATSRDYLFNETRSLTETITKQQLDVTNINSVESFFRWLSSLERPVHFFVNNAGIGVFKSLEEIDISEWKSVIETNLTGAFLCLKYAYPLLKSAKGARVINMGSISEQRGLEKNAAYAASKLGLKALSQTINEDWKNDNIFCTHVILGATATEIWNGRKGFSIEDMLNAKEVAELIVNSAMSPFKIRIDTFEILPKMGIL